MKTIEELLYELSNLDVKLWVADNQLRYKAPKGALTPSLRAKLVERKAEIITLISKTQNNLDALLSPIQPILRHKNLPLSYAQQRLWFLNQLEGENATYNMPAAIRLEGTLNQAALKQSLQEIVQRHETLRTTFVLKNGEPVLQLVTNHSPLVIIDLQPLSPEKQKIETQHLANEEAQRPFDLSKGPLLRTTLLQLNIDSHILLVTMHHIISDGWSISVFIRELSTLYQAFSQNKPSPLPPLPIQYIDFAHWQRQWLTTTILENQTSYWQQQLAGSPPLLELPTDYPRRPIKTYQGHIQPFEITPELNTKLMQLSQQLGATLFMTLFATFVTLLERYSTQEDIVVGTPIANRHRSEIEPLIGLFVNTLVLRTQLFDNVSFQELLTQVKQVCLDAYAHQDVPFEQLLEILKPTRNLSYTPIFQVMFVLQNTPIENLELSGLTFSRLALEQATAKFDLILSMEETSQGLVGSIEYSADLFRTDTIARMIGHFKTLLEGIVANPTQSIRYLPLLTANEKHQLLVEWNDTFVAYPQNQCLHQLFEAQAASTPDAIAVVFENQSLSYAELNQKANQLAHYLQTFGIKPDVVVGIYIERSLEMVIGLLGILKVGGAYLPLDSICPFARVTLILEDANVFFLLTSNQLARELSCRKTQIVCLDTWENFSSFSEDNPVNPVFPQNLAYVIYTSGSTGKPKGVLINHYNVTRLFAATKEWFQFNEQDVWTLFHSYAFDFSVWEIWGALLYGGRLIIVPYWVSRSPDTFYELLGTQGVTVLNQTPSAFRQLIQVEELRGINENLKLRFVIFGGEALEFQSLKPWFERYGEKNTQLINMYGITETTIHVTYHPITQADLSSAASVIGIPIPDLQVYVLDSCLQPQPIGIPGELYIGGAGLARGYLNSSSLTTERFIKNPFTDNSDTRLYKTGDLARYLSDGNIEYLGRIDNQVKIRGFRIEIGEIEFSILQHFSVQETVVMVKEDSYNHKYLVAYVVPKHSSVFSIAELRQFLKNWLPYYMVPVIFVPLDNLPLTPHGKVDYRALPAPQKGRESVVFIAPRTLEEELLVNIWSEVLQVEQVGISDNFFELGGDSILSIKVLAKAKEVGLEFSLQQLFQAQTLQELAHFIRQSTDSSVSIPKTQAFELIEASERLKLPDDVEDAYPLSALQAGMIFHSEYSSDTVSVYHDVFSYHLRVPYEPQALHQALQQLVNCHPILRTGFVLTSFKEPLQLVHKTIEIPLAITDLHPLSDAEQEAAIQVWIEEEKKRPFDWHHPPLWRFQLHRRSTDTFNLTFSFHHAILDGWSVASLMTELLQHYLAILGQDISFLPTPVINFRDFIALEQLTLQSKEARQFWHNTFTDITIAKLPRWPVSYRASKIKKNSIWEVPLSVEISNKLKQLAKNVNIPLRSILLAAHVRVLSVLTSQTDIVTGLVFNGRPEETDGERTLGLFLNTLPFRLRLPGGTWIDLVKETFKTEHAILPYRRFPLVEIQRMLGGQTLFETAFNFTHFHVYQAVLGLKNIDFLGGLSFEQTNFTLLADFRLDMISSQVKLTLNYDNQELDEKQIEAISDYYVAALVAMVSNPMEQYEYHSLLSESEQHKLLMEWNDTATDYPNKQCIHQLFEAQVERTPEAIAVVFEEQQLTYQQLNQKANQLAHYLQKLGVKPEVLVGICVERSLEMIIGLLGILKAGGAYVPLDPNYPLTRLSLMLEDSQVRVLLTQLSLKEKLSTYSAQVVYLDTFDEAFLQLNDNDPNSSVVPSNLAYVIYTSGSTGKPKGVQITHQSVTNFLNAMHFLELTHEDILLAVTTISFDIAVLELYLPLMVGAKIVLVNHQTASDGIRLLKKLNDSSTTVMQATPATWRMLNTAEWVASSQLKILIGGEALPHDLANQLLKRGTYVCNLYGPTETTVWSTNYQIGVVPTLTLEPESIGCPIANTQVYILDCYLKSVPIGVSGELYIGGAGLARGYLNRPSLTIEKFIPNPFSDDGSRLYKTGDLARYLPDGHLEYLGRVDNQLKLRGFRIELGEIETILEQHPLVQESVVICFETQPNDKHLIAYVVPKLEFDFQLLDDEFQKYTIEQISQWKHIWDHNYIQPVQDQNITFNLVGWISSYTGLPIPENEMREWVDATVNVILSLQPNYVLEIGCGTGLLLFRIAPHCTQYWGTDFSPIVLQKVEQLKHTVKQLGHITLSHRQADDFRDIEPESFDTIILNSVIQYFPNVTYLLDVLEQAIKIVKPGGHIFIGDIRNLSLLKTYYTSVHFFQALDSLTFLELQQNVQQYINQEEELVIAPTFFLNFAIHNPQISGLKIQPKRGYSHNELTLFRYDVIFQVDGENIVANKIPWIDWQTQKMTISTLRQQLIESQPKILELRNVPNARLEKELKILDWLNNAMPTTTVKQLRQNLSKYQSIGVEPEDLWQLGDELLYDVEISWANAKSDGSYNVLFQFRPESSKGQFSTCHFSLPISNLPFSKAWHHYANNPLQNQLSRQITQKLRQFLQNQLPAYMVPSAFVVLESLPLTPNGKIDRRTLSAFSVKSIKPSKNAFVPPHNSDEKLLTHLWSNVLNVEKLGIHDNFFELGGHSLLATQIMSKINEVFSVKLPLHHLFDSPTVAGIAKVIEKIRQKNVNIKTIIDLNADAVLEAIIQPPQFSIETSKLNSILLTGATGFLGAYLLYELLKQTRANIYCLVRSINVSVGKQRLENTLKSYFLWQETFHSRIIPIIGDLSKSWLGMEEAQFRYLANHIDVIYHNGAWVNHIYPYSVLKATNVIGTQEVLRLATQSKSKPVHFISTLGVLFYKANAKINLNIATESDIIHDGRMLEESGYLQSKWVAEQLVRQAGKRGLPLTIHRVARIGGHSQTGISNLNDFLSLAIKGYIQLGKIPILEDNRTENLIPVDCISRAIVHLSQQTNLLGKTFHLANPHPLPLINLVSWIRSWGYPLKETTYTQWRAELNHHQENALYPLLSLFPEESSDNPVSQTIVPQFDSKNTLEGLSGTDIVFPPIDATLFGTYFSYFWKNGFLERPPQKSGE